MRKRKTNINNKITVKDTATATKDTETNKKSHQPVDDPNSGFADYLKSTEGNSINFIYRF